MTATLEQQIERVSRDLVVELSGRNDASAVEAEVRRATKELASARVTQYVPVLVARTVRDRLRSTSR